MVYDHYFQIFERSSCIRKKNVFCLTNTYVQAFVNQKATYILLLLPQRTELGQMEGVTRTKVDLCPIQRDKLTVRGSITWQCEQDCLEPACLASGPGSALCRQ